MNIGQKKRSKDAQRKIKYGEEEKSLQSFASLIEKFPFENSSSAKALG